MAFSSHNPFLVTAEVLLESVKGTALIFTWGHQGILGDQVKL
jgi:hypothetical protein